MAQPNPYTRVYDFTTHDEDNPTEPPPGNMLDAEYNAVKVVTDQIRQNLKLIQRDDGALVNGIVTSDALNVYPLVIWTAGAIYARGSFVIYNAKIYMAAAAHTASSDFNADVQNGYWSYITETGAQGPQGAQGAQGAQGPAGTGNVNGPGTNHNGWLPTWNGANSKTLADGIDPATILYTGAIGSTVQAFAANLGTLSSPGNWNVFYTNGSAVQTALTVGAVGTALCGNGVTAAPSWQSVCLTANNLSDVNASTAKSNLGLANSTTSGRLARYTGTTGQTGQTGFSEDGSGNLSGIVSFAGTGVASNADAFAQTSTTHLLTPANLAGGRASFRADKNGTDQTGITSAVITKLTFTNEEWDTGSYYDAPNSKWVPPAGKVRISAGAQMTAGLVDGQIIIFRLYKNGAGFATLVATNGIGIANKTVNGTTIDNANGTDYYEIYFYADSAGTKTITGGSTFTWFEGEQI